jgi:hypothetical protein
MSLLEEANLTRAESAAVAAALAADPDLAEELDAIAAAMRPRARDAFWRALAEECPRHRRPAAAVLRALESAALERPWAG